MRLVGLTVALCVGLASPGRAQSEQTWLILPATLEGGDSSVTSTTASRLRLELIRRDIDVWSPVDAVSQFEDVVSAPPPVVTDRFIRDWNRGSADVLEQLVRGEPERALTGLEKRGLISQTSALVMNREQDAAQRFFDTCLLGVRALLEAGANGEAASMARECRLLSPVGAPTPRMHPPSVLQLLGAIDVDRADAGGSLAIDSEPPGCLARINGQEVGTTPLVVESLLQGEVTVQVESEEDPTGRLHRAVVGSQLTEVVVDVRFDRAVVTDHELSLQYPTETERGAFLAADTARVNEAIRAENVVAIEPTLARIKITRMMGGAGPSRSTAMLSTEDGPPSRATLAIVATTLIDGGCMDLTVDPPLRSCPTRESAPSPPALPPRRPRGQFISGLTLLGAGGASLLTGYVLIAPRARASEDWVGALDRGEPSAAAQERWFNYGTAITTTAAVGGGMLTAAMPLVLPNREKTPWWAWASGGVGVGLAAFAIAYGVTADSEPTIGCSNLVAAARDARTCVKRAERIDTAVLTGMTAAPLITMPLVYLLRREPKVVPGVVVSRDAAYVSFDGFF